MASLRKTCIDKIVMAIVFLNEGNRGSSRQAIEKYIIEKYNLTKRARSTINKALVDGVASRELNQVSGSGACGSFCLGNERQRQKRKNKTSKKRRAPIIEEGNDQANELETENIQVIF
jgi:hypothetical protein